MKKPIDLFFTVLLVVLGSVILTAGGALICRCIATIWHFGWNLPEFFNH